MAETNKRKKPSKFWYVDLPSTDFIDGLDPGWTNVATFRSRDGHARRDAVKFLKDTWGIPREYSALFITESWEEND